MNFFMPTRLFCGEGCVEAHADALRELGESCTIICGAHGAKAIGALDEVGRVLVEHGIVCSVWDGVTENPPVAACQEAGRYAADNGAQFILGIGGGSALDAAKAVAVFAANPDLDEDAFYAKDWDVLPLPIVCVGTTAGTGSEVTKVSVLTDSHDRKHSINDDLMYASLSFGDSRYTHSCPQKTTLSAGIDAVAHATESYFSHKADEVSRAFAVRAIRLAWGPLDAAAAGAELTAEQRRDLYEASILGGLAINTTGTCFPHNVGYYLTENYDVPHGVACAVFLPAMLERARAYDGAYADAFCAEIGRSDAELADLAVRCVPELDIHMSTEEVEAALPRWEGNGSVLNTRAHVGLSDIRAILTSLFV